MLSPVIPKYKIYLSMCRYLMHAMIIVYMNIYTFKYYIVCSIHILIRNICL